MWALLRPLAPKTISLPVPMPQFGVNRCRNWMRFPRFPHKRRYIALPKGSLPCGSVALVMHDYYAVISRAVSRLESNTPAARNAVFDRARTILIDHLQAKQPPVSDSEIIRERAALEDAIRRIESELATAIKSRTGSAYAPPLRPSRPPDQYEATNLLRRQKKPARSENRAKPTKAADKVNARHAPAERGVQPRRGLFKRSWMTLGRRIRPQLERRSTAIPDRKTTTPEQADTTAPPHAYPGAQNISKLHPKVKGPRTRPVTLAKDRGFADGLARVETIPIFDPLLGIQWLDQLMVDAARPTAPTSLQEDARTVLEWLGIEGPEAITMQHYDRFTRAFQRYISECQASSVGHAPTTNDLPFVLTDDLRGAFSRLLEREQTAKIFDQALGWFAKVWIGIFVILNVIAVIGLIATAPSLWAGIVRLSQAYSPSNVWNLAAEIVALSPALVAMLWLHRRLRHPKVTALMSFANSVPGSLIGKSVRSEAPL